MAASCFRVSNSLAGFGCARPLCLFPADSRRGAFLAEVIVCLVIAATVILPIYYTATSAVLDARHANNLRLARMLAQRKMSEIEAMGFFGEENRPMDEEGDFTDVDERYNPDLWRWSVAYDYLDVDPHAESRAEREGTEYDPAYLGDDPDDDHTPNLVLQVRLKVTYPKGLKDEFGALEMTHYLVNYLQPQAEAAANSADANAAAAAATAAGAAPAAGAGTGTGATGGAATPAGTTGAAPAGGGGK
ncbi:MAG: hypothetical protein HY719_13200 [Planctomycetes bacterium]|nr:hypothetical protein [Planctomycetota bacterium]